MKKIASLILVLVLIAAFVPASLAEGERIAIICDTVGTNLFLTQVIDKANELSAERGYESIVLECSDTDAWQNNYAMAALEGYDMIVGVGWQAASYAAEAAENDSMGTKYAVIDTDAGTDKVMSVTYNEYQAAYTMGVMAGLAFPTEKLYGYIGCNEGTGSFKYVWGFCEGVRSINPDATFCFGWTGSYTDAKPAYDFTKQMVAAGCTYIFGGAAACNEGIFQAALELAAEGTYVYSIAQDADATTESNPYILSSQLKNTGVSYQRVIDAFYADDMTAGAVVSDLASGEIGATWITNDGAYRNADILTDDVIAQCQTVVEQIISGELVLELPEYDAYQETLSGITVSLF